MNIYSFIGRLGRDAEVRATSTGSSICSFSVAVDYGFGEHKGTNWIRCSLFGKRAEGQLPKYLTKGAQVAISGELKVREYDDRDGARRTSVEVSVDKLDLVGGRSGEDESKPRREAPAAPYGGGFPEEPSSKEASDDHIPF